MSRATKPRYASPAIYELRKTMDIMQHCFRTVDDELMYLEEGMNDGGDERGVIKFKRSSLMVTADLPSPLL